MTEHRAVNPEDWWRGYQLGFDAGYLMGLRDWPSQMAQGESEPVVGRTAKPQPTGSRTGDWPGVENMSPPERKAAYAAILESWRACPSEPAPHERPT